MPDSYHQIKLLKYGKDQGQAEEINTSYINQNLKASVGAPVSNVSHACSMDSHDPVPFISDGSLSRGMVCTISVYCF